MLKKLAYYGIKHSKLNWKLLNCTAFPTVTEEIEEIINHFRCGKAVEDSYTLVISHSWLSVFIPFLIQHALNGEITTASPSEIRRQSQART